MLLIGTRNNTTQTVLADGVLALGTVYRRYCRKNRAGVPTFTATTDSVTLNTEGVYHITAKVVGSGTVAGDLSIALAVNGEAVEGAVATETVTTADTELHTLALDEYILVDSSCVLGVSSTASKTITLENTGVGATFTNVVLNITKEI